MEKKEYILSSQFSTYCQIYQNTAEFNNDTYYEFKNNTDAIVFLMEHRRYVERNKLGFGDSAFHYMWFLILDHLFRSKSMPRVLEIGVYKGQVISLWALIAKHMKRQIEIHALSPFKGNYKEPENWIGRLVEMFDWKVQNDKKRGNLYMGEDYEATIQALFSRFGLPFSSVICHRGLSGDPAILKILEGFTFDMIYIDGDHSFEGATADITNFSPKVEKGGFLVMDDAACLIPSGEGLYWKGHEEVSKAAEIIPSLGFENVLNVGHNRIYQRI